MKKKEMISVIVPVYNSERYLPDCLESILGQSFVELELICIDNASADSSVDIIKKYQNKDSRVHCIENDNNYGQAYSRNVGIKCAKGKYIFFVDSDDMLKNDALEHLYKTMEKDLLDVVFFDADVLYEMPITDYYKPRRSGFYHNVDSGKRLFVKLIRNGDYDAVVWRQFWLASFLKNNNIRFHIKTSPHEDLLFTFQSMLTAKRIKCVSESYYIYRRHTGAITMRTATKNQMVARFISYVESLMFSRKVLDDNDSGLSDAVLTYLNSQRKCILAVINKLLQDGYPLEMVNFGDSFYNMYFQLFMKQETSIIDNYLLKELCTVISSHSHIIVYGAGAIGQKAVQFLEMLGNTKYMIAVTDNSRCAITPSGKPIYNIEELKEYRKQSIVLIATSVRYHEEIMSKLKELGFKNYLCLV